MQTKKSRRVTVFRAGVELQAAIEEHAKKLQAACPGMRVSVAAAIRDLILKGLDK